jgi:hypothetical protein
VESPDRRESKLEEDGPVPSSPVLQESTRLQWLSRPSPTAAFLHSAPAGSGGTTPAVPALYDGQRLYALQGSNAKLVVSGWGTGSTDGGRNDHDTDAAPTCVATLDRPALSLALLQHHRPLNSASHVAVVLFGSCQDGRVYVAYEAGKDGPWRVEYFESYANQKLDPNCLVGTVASTWYSGGSTFVENRKRKIDEGEQVDGRIEYTLSQVYREDRGVSLIRYKIVVGSETAMIECTAQEQTSIELLGRKLSLERIRDLKVVGMVDANSAVVVSFHACSLTANGTKPAPSQYYASISTRTNEMIGSPVPLAPNTTHTGIVGTALFAALTEDGNIVLYDCVRGACVYDAALSFLQTSTPAAFVVGNSRCSRLAVAYLKDGAWFVAHATVALESTVHDRQVAGIQSKRLTLACGMTSALSIGNIVAGLVKANTMLLDDELSSRHCENAAEQKALDTGTCGCDGPKWRLVTMYLSVIFVLFFLPPLFHTKGLSIFKDACKHVQSGSQCATEPFFLAKAYRVAYKAACSGTISISEGQQGNPQDAILSKNGKLVNGTKFVNGIHASPQKVKGLVSTINGNSEDISRLKTWKASESASVTSEDDHDDDDASRSDIVLHCDGRPPQEFVLGASSLVVDILCSLRKAGVDTARNDARFILKTLVQSTKLSARSQLVNTLSGHSISLYSLMRSMELSTNASCAKSAYSPVEMIIDLMACCSDVSEHMIASILRYMVTRAVPRDVARFWKAKIAQDEHAMLGKCQRLLVLESLSSPTTDQRNECKRIGARILLVATASILQQLMSSSFNKTLLREALKSAMSVDELRLLARILVQTARKPERLLFHGERRNMYSIAKCMVIVADCIRDADSVGNDSAVDLILHAVQKEVTISGRILGLQKLINEAADAIGLARKVPARSGRLKAKENATPKGLAPYQIERLVF